MTRENIPTNYIGEEIPPNDILSYKSGSENQALYIPDTLFDGILKKQGAYGAFNLGNSRAYAEFVVPEGYRNVEVWLTCGHYSDSLGSTGKSTSLCKLDESTKQYVVMNDNVPTTKTSNWFKYYEGLNSGRYRMYAKDAYVQLNEMFMSGERDSHTLFKIDGVYKYYHHTEESKGWEVVSDTLPTSEEFTNQGMKSLSPIFDRRSVQLEIPLTQKLNLKKYPYIKSIKIKG